MAVIVGGRHTGLNISETSDFWISSIQNGLKWEKMSRTDSNPAQWAAVEDDFNCDF